MNTNLDVKNFCIDCDEYTMIDAMNVSRKSRWLKFDSSDKENLTKMLSLAKTVEGVETCEKDGVIYVRFPETIRSKRRIKLVNPISSISKAIRHSSKKDSSYMQYCAVVMKQG